VILLRGRRTLSAALGLLGLGALAHGLAAQQAPDPARRGFELERRGNYGDAVGAYRDALKKKPNDAAALFGLERSLIALDRPADILPDARAAIAASPGTGAFYGVALRAWAASGRPDSVRAVAQQWAAVDSTDETPYREWGAAALARHDRDEARKAYQTARDRLHRPDALAGELAMVLSEEHDWAGAVREWSTAVAKVSGYRSTAVRALSPAPEEDRSKILRDFGKQTAPTARWVEADLRAQWGDPLGGYQVLSANLPNDRGRAVEAISGFLDQVRDQTGPEPRRAQGLALAALADRTPGPGGSQLRLEAAQAFADAGDQAAAKRLLGGMATAIDLTSGAGVTLVGVLVKEGKVEDAERKLEQLKPGLVSEDWMALRRTVAWGWVRAGKLDRADSMIVADSSVEGLAMAGQLRLFHGDLDSAAILLKLAGPFAGTRDEATARTATLAMLQPIQADTLPALGAGLLAVERGDTARGVQQLEKVADGLPVDAGGAEIRLYAGRLAQSAGRTADAERLLRSAAVPDAKTTAPAAELALAQLLLDSGRAKEATEVLEQMILGFPESALVPQARRLLDQARGAVPQT
jgi:tetratricopeptide (TPR) repeat protein